MAVSDWQAWAANVERLIADITRRLANLEIQKELVTILTEIRQQQVEDGDVLRRIEWLLTESPIPAPLPITEWRLVNERKENDMTVLDYEAHLPPIPDVPENSDVVSQRILVMADGVEVSTKDEPKLADVTKFTVKKGVSVTLTRSLVDDDGNVGPSTASETFISDDTIPPSAPGDFGAITLLAEREEPTADESAPTADVTAPTP